MYKLILNGTEVKQPSNLINLLLTKVRSDIFKGFVIGDYGYYANNEGLEITDSDTVDLIKNLVILDGVKTKVEAILKYCDNTIFNGYLDFSTYKNTECYRVSINLASDTKGDIVNSKRNITYSIPPKSKITLTKKNYISGGNYQVGEQSKFNLTTTGVGLNVGVPLKSDNKINGMQDSDIGDGTFFVAQKDSTLRLLGSINWTENLEFDYDLEIIVKDSAGSIISTSVLQSFVHGGGALMVRQYTISRDIVLLTGYKVSLRLFDATIDFPYEINFLSSTSIEVTDNLEDEIVANESDCYGIYAFDAFKEIVRRIDPGITFKSDFFKSGYGANDFLTNGNNIRGIASDLNLSLEYLFTNFDPLYDLKLDFESNELRIEKQVLGNKKASFINGVVSKYSEETDLDRLYSSVKVGFSTWQSESKLKGLEHNSIRTYESELAFGSRELDLVSGFVTAGYIIEEQRRLQYDADEKLKEHKFDENIFLIAVENGIPESLKNYNPVANIILGGGVYNFKYSPLQILENNARKLENIGIIKFASGEGNINLVINGNFENQSFNFGEIMPMKCTFECVIDFEEFKSLDEIGIETCGEDRFLRCDEVNMTLQQNGTGFVNVNGKII